MDAQEILKTLVTADLVRLSLYLVAAALSLLALALCALILSIKKQR